MGMTGTAQIIKLSSFHKHIAFLVAQGQSRSQIQEQFGVTSTTISVWLNMPAFREQVATYQKQIEDEVVTYATQKMKHLQSKAVDRLDWLMDHAESESVQLGAVREVLERGPLRIVKGIDLSKMAPGTVVLQERMLLAMQQVSQLIGDEEMSSALLPMLQEEVTDISPQNIDMSHNGTHDSQESDLGEAGS